MFVDLGADSPLAAEKAGQQIAVEVKSFLGTSDIVEMERALGQFVLYKYLLDTQFPNHQLFLAMPERAFTSVFNTVAGRGFVESCGIRILVIDKQERIEKWLEPSIPQL